MNRIVNGVILMLLVLSVLTIFSVEFEFQLIKINVSKITCLKINRICLNLSYSFFAGLIMYVLTVLIPRSTRKRIYKPLVVYIIDDYYYRSMFQYFSYCTDRNSFIPLAKDDQYLKNYCSKMDQKFGRKNIMDGQMITKSFVERFDSLKTLTEVNRSFINTIIPYEDYLTAKQITIFTKIRKNQFYMYVDAHGNGIKDEDSSELNKSLYEAAKSLIKFIDEIHNSTENWH